VASTTGSIALGVAAVTRRNYTPGGAAIGTAC
jgi:hypothetical protein